MLAALANGATLLLIAFEILRVVVFALREHDHDDLNTRSAFLHVLGDALASIGVIVAGLAILLTGWAWLDPAVSVLIGLLILLSSGRVLKESIHILAEGMPEGMTASAIADAMRAVPGVGDIHDLHAWTAGPGLTALSAHIIVTDQAISQSASV